MNIFNFIKSKETKMTGRDWLILVGSMVVFSAISLGNITRWSIWFDEAYGIYLTQFSYADVARYTAVDVHPPLYYWLLKAWQGLFGSSELALRSISLVGILIAMIFTYLIVKRLFDTRAAGLTVGLMALSPILIRYSEEARMYGLATAIVAAATYVYICANQSPSRRKWVIYGILVSLGMWTHYFTALVWLAHWAWRLVALRSGQIKKFFTADWIIAHVVAVGLFLPWLPHMAYQMTGVQGGGFWIGPVGIATPFGFLGDILLYREAAEALGWYVYLLLAIMVLGIILIYRTAKALGAAEKRSYQMLLVFCLLPLGLLMLISMPPLRSAFVDRYLLPTIPFWFALFGVTLARSLQDVRLHKMAKLTLLLLVAGLISGVVYVYQIGNYNKASQDLLPVRPTMQLIQQNAKDGEVVLASTIWRYYEAHYYDSVRNQVYFEAYDKLTWGSYVPLRDNDYRKVRDIKEFARSHGGTIWYLGDWVDVGKPKLPSVGKWKVLQEVHASNVPDNRMALRAVEIQLQD